MSFHHLLINTCDCRVCVSQSLYMVTSSQCTFMMLLRDLMTVIMSYVFTSYQWNGYCKLVIYVWFVLVSRMQQVLENITLRIQGCVSRELIFKCLQLLPHVKGRGLETFIVIIVSEYKNLFLGDLIYTWSDLMYSLCGTGAVRTILEICKSNFEMSEEMDI